MRDELGVIIKARDLTDYILLITDKSPKKFRMTLISRLVNLSLDIVENLYRANAIKAVDMQSKETRLQYQREAKVSIDMLCCVAEIARKQQCIQPKHFNQICIMSTEVRKMLYAWVKSDLKRYKEI